MGTHVRTTYEMTVVSAGSSLCLTINDAVDSRPSAHTVFFWATVKSPEPVYLLERARTCEPIYSSYLRNDLIVLPGERRRLTFYTGIHACIRVWILRDEKGGLSISLEGGTLNEVCRDGTLNREEPLIRQRTHRR